MRTSSITLRPIRFISQCPSRTVRNTMTPTPERYEMMTPFCWLWRFSIISVVKYLCLFFSLLQDILSEWKWSESIWARSARFRQIQNQSERRNMEPHQGDAQSCWWHGCRETIDLRHQHRLWQVRYHCHTRGSAGAASSKPDSIACVRHRRLLVHEACANADGAQNQRAC